jgi:hypothetical protein
MLTSYPTIVTLFYGWRGLSSLYPLSIQNFACKPLISHDNLIFQLQCFGDIHMKRSHDQTNTTEGTAQSEEEKAVKKIYLLQKMNYHISQLPGATKCPSAPGPLPSLTLPDLIQEDPKPNNNKNKG